MKLKLYTAIYLKERPLVALPFGVKAINHEPHVTLSVFESDEVRPQIIDWDREFVVSDSLYALHGRHTQQIMFVCSVITEPSLFLPEFIPAEQGRIYHVTVGSIELTDETAGRYPHLSLVSKSEEYTTLTSDRLVIEPFKPVKY